jgi:hypothetical protein
MILANVIGAVAGIGKTYLANKSEEKQAKHLAKMSVIQNDAHWESKMADSTANSFKDELVLITLLLPVWIIFYGAMVGDDEIIQRVQSGFVAIQACPDEFWYLLFVACTASFGVKGADKLMKLRKK